MKPALLFLAHRVPYPPNKGDKIRSFNLLKYLSERYRIFLGTFVDDVADHAAVDALTRYCTETCAVPLSPALSRVRSLGGLLGGAPLTLSYYHSRQLASWIEQVRERECIDRVLVFSSAMAQYVLEAGWETSRRVIDFVDVDSDKWAQYAASKAWSTKWLYRREARSLLAFEKRVMEDFDVGIFVSEKEADLFRSLAPASTSKIRHINNGVDLEYFSLHGEYANPYGPAQKAIVFTGAMDYWPNVDAVEWFARAVLPIIRKKDPAVVFYVVGAKPASSIKALGKQPEVFVTGRVSDVRPYLRFAKASVAPLRIARGVQNKVLESMAMGCPTVVTQAALDGIDALPDRDLLIGDDEAAFADAVLSILSSPELASSLAGGGRAFIEERYTWGHSLEPLEELLVV